MTLLNLFKRNKRQPSSADYVPDMDEYARIEPPSAELRTLYTYVKVIFLILFPIGCTLSFFHFFFILCAAALSSLISYYSMNRFLPLLNTRLKLFVFMVVPPVCLITGFVVGFVFFSQIKEYVDGF